jgi:hypothetical protein
VSKLLKPRKAPVVVRPSRIRRDPVPVQAPPRQGHWDPTAWETWIVLIGVLAFALALSALAIGISEATSH